MPFSRYDQKCATQRIKKQQVSVGAVTTGVSRLYVGNITSIAIVSGKGTCTSIRRGYCNVAFMFIYVQIDLLIRKDDYKL